MTREIKCLRLFRNPKNTKRLMGEFECTCGTKFVTSEYAIRTGKTKSCGCARNIAAAKLKTTHGMSHTKEYRAWVLMIARGSGKMGAKYYVDRGICVDDRWRSSFTNFLEDMGNAPSPTHSLDRIDNDKGYTKDNCRWATKLTQSTNRRCVTTYLFNGENLTSPEIERRYGVCRMTFIGRIKKGWSVSDAITKPIRGSK